MIRFFLKLPMKAQNLIITIICKLDGGLYWSKKIRKIYKLAYHIEIGIGSYGCFDRRKFPQNTVIGNYCSIAVGVKYLNGNHPMDRISMHPLFYNKELGFVKKDTIKRTNLIIGNDVWIGCNALITSSCTKIGNGAVVGAGSVVTKDVPAYAVVVGNPARIIKYRFDKETIDLIEKTEWWKYDKNILSKLIDKNDDINTFCRGLNNIVGEKIKK